MSTIACPKCKRFVVIAEVPELSDVVLFEVDEVLVLVDHGSKLSKGCIPHVCQGLPAIVDRTKYIPIEEVVITCKYCEEDSLAINATFDVEQGWKCSLCAKDHAEQAAKKSRK